MKDVFLTTYSIALPVILSYIVWILKNQKKDRDANTRGTMLLLWVQLTEYYHKYATAEEIPCYVYQNFSRMYEAYKELDDSDDPVLEKMHKEIEELHIKKNQNEEI